jgi:hypothetical protein
VLPVDRLESPLQLLDLLTAPRQGVLCHTCPKTSVSNMYLLAAPHSWRAMTSKPTPSPPCSLHYNCICSNSSTILQAPGKPYLGLQRVKGGEPPRQPEAVRLTSLFFPLPDDHQRAGVFLGWEAPCL